MMIKLPGRSLGINVFSAEEDHVMNFEVGGFFDKSVIVLGLGGLGSADVFRELSMNGLEGFEVIGGCWDTGLRLDSRWVQWVITVIGLEWGELGGGMDRVVVCEFSQIEDIRPIVLVVVAVVSEICFEDLIHSLSLTIRLRVEGCGEVWFCTKSFDEFTPEVGVEDGSTIRDDICGNAMESNNVVEEHFGKIRSIKAFFFVWDKVCLLGKTIDKDLDGVITIGEG